MMCCWFFFIASDNFLLCAKHLLGVALILYVMECYWWYIGREIEADIDTILWFEPLKKMKRFMG